VQNPVSTAYESLVAKGVIERDPAQTEVVRRLDKLVADLAEHRLARKSSALGWLFAARRQAPFVRGYYLWGSVGRGKTMLMDLFFQAATVQRKRRVHFHAFMGDVHARIHAWRQQKKLGKVKGEDPIAPVADAMADEAWLLCFDEFAVTDIADAMILGRLFTALFARGVVVIATSNVEPGRLYEGGLNRALFLPFISLLHERVEVINLNSRTDFRLEKLSGSKVYHVPADATAKAAMDAMFLSLTGWEIGLPGKVEVLGRLIDVPQARANVARFQFDDLCRRPLAANDYLALAEEYDTIFIDNIPQIQPHERNEAKRFINLIDTLYDRHVKLIASAAAEPHELYLGTEGREVFEFDRTSSRLIEMRSTEYLASAHGDAESKATGNSTGLVET
jgi:cell division protein ZapE